MEYQGVPSSIPSSRMDTIPGCSNLMRALDLPPDAPQQPCIRDPHGLQGHILPGRGMASVVHDAHPARPEASENLVGAEGGGRSGHSTATFGA